MSIEIRVIDILKKELLNETVNADSSHENTIGWDSQFFLVLIIVIEEEFDIVISNDKLDRLTSVQDIVKLIQES